MHFKKNILCFKKNWENKHTHTCTQSITQFKLLKFKGERI